MRAVIHRAFRRPLLALLLIVLAGHAAVTSFSAEFFRRRDKSDVFFESGIFPALRIEVSSSNYARLQKDPRAYVPVTVHDGDKVYPDVGLHLKGAAGSARGIDADPALTLNFDKFRDGQKFQGLDKLHLNNSVQDPSLMTEAICSELFLAAGVPTARTTHARVWLNNRDLGLYVLKEGYDRAFLKRHFENAKGNLYDGGFLRDITENLQRDPGEGDVENYRDLRAVVAAARSPDFARRMSRLEQVLDVDRFLTFIAMEILTEHWDGYALKRNNYRVYHDPSSGRCVFIPHGMDQMFWSASRIFMPTSEMEGLVAQSILATVDGQQRYRQRVVSLATNVFTMERLTNHFHQLQARLRPALAAISPGHARNHETHAKVVWDRIVARVARVQQMAAEPIPEPVEFDSGGIAVLDRWRPVDPRKTNRLDIVDAGGRKALHIVAGADKRCTASWRQAVRLPNGSYVFAARMRTAGVVALTNEVAVAPNVASTSPGPGAGIRISRPRGPNPPRGERMLGTTEWQQVEYEFAVSGESGEYDLVCELRASEGEVWFETASLRLRRRPPAAAKAPRPAAGAGASNPAVTPAPLPLPSLEKLK